MTEFYTIYFILIALVQNQLNANIKCNGLKLNLFFSFMKTFTTGTDHRLKDESLLLFGIYIFIIYHFLLLLLYYFF